MTFKSIAELADRDWILMSVVQRYGSATVVMMAPYAPAIIGQALETLSDGDNDALEMQDFLDSISGWYPVAEGQSFTQALSKLDAKIEALGMANESYSTDFHGEVESIIYHLKWWQEVRNEPPCVRIGLGPKAIGDAWNYRNSEIM